MTHSSISDVLKTLGAADEKFSARLHGHAPAVEVALREIYGERTDFADIFSAIMQVATKSWLVRKDDLKQLDERRLEKPDWFQQSGQIGYTAYVDRFAGTLNGVAHNTGYLKELGITYLHLLPLLKMRPDNNDGGFAVSDYGQVDPAFGSNDDLQKLARKLHTNGISLCIDLTLNHTADDHAWALAAKADDPHYRAFYYMYPDRTEPDELEKTLYEVFPDTAPGNFTQVPETGEWVWTTFYPYQWDLNYSNPDVLRSVLSAMLFLANLGVDVFRLDAAPFLWKRKGTDSMNQPEVFSIIRTLQALLAIAAPAAILKAEEVVPSYRLIRYLGAGEGAGTVCQLAYNTTLMVLSWGALAEGKVHRLVNVLESLPDLPQGSAWLNYVRCHDDIGWGVLFEEDADYGARDWHDYAACLRRFYRGDEVHSFAAGKDDQRTSTNGTAASLCGLETALKTGDVTTINTAMNRMLALYTLAYAYGGIPLINMGDEIGLPNDHEFASHGRFDGDGRWLQRGFMDWESAARRNAQGHEARLFSAFAQLAQIRQKSPMLSGSIAEPQAHADGRVLSLHHRNKAGELSVLVNFSNQPVQINLPASGPWRDELTGERLVRIQMEMPPYGRLWLVPEEAEKG